MGKKWISVKEDIPEIIGGYYSNRVLVITSSGFYAIGYFMHNTWQRDGGKSFIETGYEVTHWQPLPEPPNQ